MEIEAEAVDNIEKLFRRICESRLRHRSASISLTARAPLYAKPSFIKRLLEPDLACLCVAWVKNSATRFYEIDYAWKKGEHPKRGKFSPDFFIILETRVIVVEVKGDEELSEPSPENFKKNEYALAHFARINTHLSDLGESMRYKFCFLTPSCFNTFFQELRQGNIDLFRSELDVVLASDT